METSKEQSGEGKGDTMLNRYTDELKQNIKEEIEKQESSIDVTIETKVKKELQMVREKFEESLLARDKVHDEITNIAK